MINLRKSMEFFRKFPKIWTKYLWW